MFDTEQRSPMDGKTAYEYVVNGLCQKSISYHTLKQLIPERMMLYGSDGWGIAITPFLIFSESESGLSVHQLKTPIDVNGDWQGKGLDWILMHDPRYKWDEIPGDSIQEAIDFVDNLHKKAKEFMDSIAKQN